MKKKLKKLLAGAVALGMMVACLPQAVIADSGDTGTYGDFEYKELDDGTLSITGYNGDGGEVVIPSEIKGKAVTEISESAFRGCTLIKSIEIPNGITSIGAQAFMDCYSLTSVKIPDSVTSIGDEAFYGCVSLESVDLGNGVETIGSYAFRNCTSLESLEIPDSVISIGEYAFVFKSGDYEYYLNTLTTITICSYNGESTELEIPNEIDGRTVVDIVGAFYGCISLTSVKIPDSVTSIGESAFYECTSLTSVEIPESVTSIGDYAFCGCESLLSVTIPDSIEYIRNGTFAYCSSLTNITIPDNIISIFNYAFAYCSSIKQITIPSSVTKIFNYAFIECKSLVSINVSDDNKYYTSVDGVLFNKYKTNLIIYPAGKTDTTYTISKIVSSINRFAFDHCTNLTSIDVDSESSYYTSIDGVLFNKNETTLVAYPAGKEDKEYIIPDGVTTIMDSAFCGCSFLTSVVIPYGVTTINEYTFEDCTSLKSIEIPDSVTEIDAYAFWNCTSLETVDLGKSVEEIDTSSFSGCTSLTAINVDGENETYASVDGVLFDKDITYIIFFPLGKEGKYIIPDSVTYLAIYEFYNCNKLTSIEIPNSVTFIDPCAFYGCTSLESVTILNSKAEISSYAFDNCDNLTTIYGYTGSTAQTYANENNLTFVPIDTLLGDLDNSGDVTAWDSVLLARYLAHWNNIDINESAADLDGDGEVTLWDSVLLARQLAGWGS